MPNAQKVITELLGLTGLAANSIKGKSKTELPSFEELQKAVLAIDNMPPPRETYTPILPVTENESLVTVDATQEPPIEPIAVEVQHYPSTKGTACLPCSSDHLSTCSGLLSEAMRFARTDGVDNDEVLKRIAKCQDELNAMERVDLSPEVMVTLKDWEKKLAEKVLNLSRDIRHNIIDITDKENLEKLAAQVQSDSQNWRQEWMKQRIKQMKPEEKEQLKQKTQEIMERVLEGEPDQSSS